MKFSAISLVLLGALAPLAQAAEYDPATADAELLNAKIVTKSLLTDVVATESGAVAVGERGHVLKSSNLTDWVQLPVPTRSVLTNVYALGAHLWAVGHEEVILHSADGGSTWARQHVNVDALGPLLDVIFLDPQRGFAFGAEGRMLTTSDGGATWNADNITSRLTTSTVKKEEVETDDGLASDDIGEDETPPHLNAVVRNSQGMLIVGESGAVFKSTDDGASWTRLALPYTGPLFGAIVMEDDSIIGYGLNGHVFQTRDLGTNWLALETNTEASIMGGVAIVGNRAVFVGARGTVLLKPADADSMKAFTFSDGGILSGVISRSETEFTLVGENGIFTYSPANK
jgi:photosystem II stability/assembly factor-like uncharacterized protein